MLKERVTITDDDLRQYYEANAERFLHPEQTEVPGNSRKNGNRSTAVERDDRGRRRFWRPSEEIFGSIARGA